MPGETRSEYGAGLAYGFTAYALWGLFPLYFALLDAVPPIEVVAYRIWWSFVLLAVIITVIRAWRPLLALARNPRVLLPLAAGAVLLAINWGVYVYAVSTDQVVEASLGYFINPLVSVALGVIVLRETLRRAQWVALALAVLAVLVMSILMGTPPWISPILAFSFGLYGLTKKRVDIESVQSLTIETAVLAPIALAFIVIGEVDGTASLGRDGLGLTVLLVLLGPVTAIPLLLFGAAARRMPLSTVGALQYSTPILQFILGITVFGEVMSTGRWIGFALVWVALVIFTVDALRQARRMRSPDPASADALAVTEPD